MKQHQKGFLCSTNRFGAACIRILDITEIITEKTRNLYITKELKQVLQQMLNVIFKNSIDRNLGYEF